MAQPKNKKRRSRKRDRTAQGATGARPDDGAGAPQGRLTKAQRTQKAKEARRAAPGAPTMRAPLAEAPPPIWAPLPITEGLILIGIIAGVVGFIVQSFGLVFGGLAMIMLPSLELAIREHLAGFRSHTTLIAAVIALLVTVAVGFGLNAANVGLPQWPLLVLALVIFIGVFRLMRGTFRERSGGVAFRV